MKYDANDIVLRVPAVIAVAVALGLPGCGCNNPFVNNSADSTTPIEEFDLEENGGVAYYYRNSDIYSVMDASESADALGEGDAVASFSERGFEDAEVTSEVEDGGVLADETSLSSESNDAHPIYTTYYESDSGDWWMIYAVDGDFMASPVSYNLGSGETEVIVSENEYITSYDINADRFYRVVPTDGSCVIVTVEKIDAETLDALSAGELGAAQ